MTEYRLYTVESDGHFIGSRTFTADSDDDAVVWGKNILKITRSSFGVVRGL